MSFAARAAERASLLGLPVYPSYQLQQELDRTSKLWLCLARAQAALGPAPLNQIHLLGTNHLMPWFAARVADAVRRQAARGAPYASIAIELPPSQHTSMAACAELLHPVLEELAHTRFARMPDLRALQRITGTDTRERVGAELESHGLEPASMLLFGFIEGMELLQALRIGQLEEIPVHCIDLPPSFQQDPHSLHTAMQTTAMQTTAMTTQTTHAHPPTSLDTPQCDSDLYGHGMPAMQSGLGPGQGRAPHGSADNGGPMVGSGKPARGYTDSGGGKSLRATSAGQRGLGPGQGSALHGGDNGGPSLRAIVEHVMDMRVQAAMQHQSLAVHGPMRQHPLHDAQAVWLDKAAEMLEAGVDRNLLFRDEFYCMSKFTSAWADPAALVRPRALRDVLNMALGWSFAARARAPSPNDAADAAADWSADPRAAHRAPDTGYTLQQAEREVFMAQRISGLPRPVLCVMGAAHVWGVQRALRALLVRH